MRRPQVHREGAGAVSNKTQIVLLIAVLAVLLVAFGAWVAAKLVDPTTPALVAMFFALATGSFTYPALAWVFFLLYLGFLAGVCAGGVWFWRKVSANRVPEDQTAALLCTRKHVANLTEKRMRQNAQRLGVKSATFGSPLGTSVLTGAPLFASLEWVQLWVLGPRAGKTTSVVVRQAIEHDGPVVMTSNKPDVVQLARGPRSEAGRVWVQDPQQVYGEPCTWWWNPLSYVVDVPTSRKLTDLFVAAARTEGARSDGYFDGAAKDVLSGMLLAAACANLPLTVVGQWLADPGDETPADITKGHGYTQVALELRANARTTEKQRDGVYRSAGQIMGFLADNKAMAWVSADKGDTRPQFDVDAFVRSRDTLYLLSKEGGATARALTAALTVAVSEAAQRFATTQPGGRLSVPLALILDEAANICRWPDLPDLYSHFGSRGIVVSTFLQSWSQAVAVWGREGAWKMWSAANIAVVGNSVKEVPFLDQVSALLGDHDVVTGDRAYSRGGSTTTYRTSRERNLTSADLAALPQGRAVMFVSGSRPILLATTHYSQTDYADKVRESAEHYAGSPASVSVPA